MGVKFRFGMINKVDKNNPLIDYSIKRYSRSEYNSDYYVHWDHSIFLGRIHHKYKLKVTCCNFKLCTGKILFEEETIH